MTMIDTTDVGAAVHRLKAAKRVLVTYHSSPDGDAIGSALVLGELARGLGLEVDIVANDPVPASLADLPGIRDILVCDAVPQSVIDACDLVVTLECPDLERSGFDGLDRRPMLNIDHHPTNSRYGEVNVVDADAPAVGEMIWQMFEPAGQAPSGDAATNAYVALTTDTGDFRYANATQRAFRAAGEMVAAGADPVRVAEWIHNRRTESSVRLLGEALQNLELRCRGRLATMWVDPPAFARAGASPADTEDVITSPRSIAGVLVVAFLKQWEPDSIRVSLRSTGSLDVCRVAGLFGGGGHLNAAGCSMTGTIDEAREKLVGELEALISSEDA